MGAVVGVARRHKQALLNLLSNATKFAGPGGEIRVTARAAAKKLEITVWDSEPGIATADLERLFKPFTTLDEPLTRRTRARAWGWR
ncbi:MAG: sensor histidine kinase [Myxococcaceae bacterium]|nr:sensor histidine kinase [Myxococcaceae bacterium]